MAITQTIRDILNYGLDPFGKKAAQANLDAQRDLAAQLNLDRQLQITRQQQAGTLDPEAYRRLQGTTPSYEDLISQIDAQARAATGYGGGGISGDISKEVDDLFGQLKNSFDEGMNLYGEADRKLGEFKEKNPFSFDEAQARASADERFSPYYEAELGEFVTGVERQRSRSVQDEQRLREELTTDTDKYVGRVKRSVDDALAASNEGFAGSGLFFGGQRLRRGGREQISGAENIEDARLNQQRGLLESGLRQTRTGEDIDLNKRTFERRLGAERETQTLNDIERQKQEEENRYYHEATQYAGLPYSSYTGNLRNLLFT